MTAAAAVEPTELEELMKAQAEAAHEREVGDATRPTAEDLAASPTRIDVEGLDLFYGDHHALKDVNIKIRDKQITSFIGPSGCGKSTLLRCFNRMNDGIKDCRIEADGSKTLLPLGAGDMDYSAIRAFLATHAPAAPLLRDEVILPVDTADVRYLRRMTDTV